jgi:L-amino acid N-acyltransferase YncA
MTSIPVIRNALVEDIPAITAIYGLHVRQGTSSFELTPPSEVDMARRREAIVTSGLPYLVAEIDGRIAGYAYAGPYRLRPAYRYTVENSVYVADWAQRRGVGQALLNALIPACEAAGMRQMIAIIGDTGNVASIALHRSVGFQHVGTLKTVGYKHDRWLDVVIMQRPLGPGAAVPPTYESHLLEGCVSGRDVSSP